jgi:hypothetical protein
MLILRVFAGVTNNHSLTAPFSHRIDAEASFWDAAVPEDGFEQRNRLSPDLVDCFGHRRKCLASTHSLEIGLKLPILCFVKSHAAPREPN